MMTLVVVWFYHMAVADGHMYNPRLYKHSCAPPMNPGCLCVRFKPHAYGSPKHIQQS
jgi:hypothetical protein